MWPHHLKRREREKIPYSLLLFYHFAIKIPSHTHTAQTRRRLFRTCSPRAFCYFASSLLFLQVLTATATIDDDKDRRSEMLIMMKRWKIRCVHTSCCFCATFVETIIAARLPHDPSRRSAQQNMSYYNALTLPAAAAAVVANTLKSWCNAHQRRRLYDCVFKRVCHHSFSSLLNIVLRLYSYWTWHSKWRWTKLTSLIPSAAAAIEGGVGGGGHDKVIHFFSLSYSALSIGRASERMKEEGGGEREK